MKALNIVTDIMNPSSWATWNYYVSNFFWTRARPMYYFYFPIWRIFSVITGVEIYGRTKIGKGLKIRHFGQIFINPSSIIGDNCIIYNGVTIGNAKYDVVSDCPVVMNNVKIGTGAKILGKITIGNNCEIGANSVVVKSFPDNSVIAGVPAQILKIKSV